MTDIRFSTFVNRWCRRTVRGIGALGALHQGVYGHAVAASVPVPAVLRSRRRTRGALLSWVDRAGAALGKVD
ncbi:hypothetical protein [Mycobacterium seoulense]|uniref:hypothetical protein n=1 Tax=Mycobacterium seoulense TaxID=386911 RepID=UPI0013D3594B|nr:hypothetical protein [Mycobacterium seoulense]MCV7435732.1 hypothetical protein [Mycobacterium seoulense]